MNKERGGTPNAQPDRGENAMQIYIQSTRNPYSKREKFVRASQFCERQNAERGRGEEGYPGEKNYTEIHREVTRLHKQHFRQKAADRSSGRRRNTEKELRSVTSVTPPCPSV